MGYTDRGYPLPMPENSAIEDVVRINSAIKMIDDDIQNTFDHRSQQYLENMIELWSD